MDFGEPMPELMGDLTYWEVKLTSGEVITLRAHTAREEGDTYVFVALMDGSPPFEYELARVPAAVVEKVEWQGGSPTPRG
jgi:hypothetical protein